jgi:diguanylate cyclase (GGDEF)-like protein
LVRAAVWHRSIIARRGASLLVLTVVYFIAAKLGLRLAFVNASATAVWPTTGIALAALLLFGWELWPAVLVGAFAANLTTAGTVATSLGIATGNTLEALVGAYLVRRYARGREACDRAGTTFRFVVLGGLVSTMVSASIGVTSLVLGGLAPWADAGPIWLTWWLGDAGGAVIVTPVLLQWISRPRVHWSRRQVLEAVGLLAGLALVSLMVFAGLYPSSVKDYPLEFLCVPFLLWAAFRFGRREAATAIVILAAIAIWGTLRGYGPFQRPSPNESLLLLQAFLGVKAVMTLTVAAVVAERREAAEQLRHLAGSDPLTGLANYRQLVNVLDAEIKRSSRTARPFAILFFDVDRLKRINDRHGHLVGSRALCRLADAMRATCRAIDTAARYGGDEFALVLPETGAAAARRVGHRVSARLADGEQPAVSVSVGIALYPRDGGTVESLLGAADQALYVAKGAGRGRGHLLH